MRSYEFFIKKQNDRTYRSTSLRIVGWMRCIYIRMVRILSTLDVKDRRIHYRNIHATLHSEWLHEYMYIFLDDDQHNFSKT